VPRRKASGVVRAEKRIPRKMGNDAGNSTFPTPTITTIFAVETSREMKAPPLAVTYCPLDTLPSRAHTCPARDARAGACRPYAQFRLQRLLYLRPRVHALHEGFDIREGREVEFDTRCPTRHRVKIGIRDRETCCPYIGTGGEDKPRGT
jgi:hypothetical protein